MRVSFDGVLTKVTTKRAKRDKDGTIVDEPAVAITLDVPVSDLSPSQLGALLRAADRSLRVDLDDLQSAFDIVDRNGSRELAPEPIGR